MNKVIFIFLLGIIISCQSNSHKERQLDPKTVALQDSITYELEEIHKQSFINGFGVAIVNQNKTLYQKGIGFSNIYTKTKYTENTIQNIGSVSKTFIGIALMKAQELGKLKLDDPINKHLPFEIKNPSFPELQITIRHLATHTSGILDNEYYNDKAYVLKELSPSSQKIEGFSEIMNPAGSKISMLEFLKKVLTEEGEWFNKNAFSKNKPGVIFEYSNVGATLAAAIIETATGKSYQEFTKKHIFNPLKMESSGWAFEDIDMNNHTFLYAKPEKEIPFYSLITYPDGGLITSMNDLSKYLTELIKGQSGDGTLLNNNSYKELFSQQLKANNFTFRDEENPYDDEYYSGIFMGFSAKGNVGHTGGDPGIASFMFFNPKTKTGKILMINTSIMNADGVKEFFAIWKTLEKYENKF